MEDTMKKNSSGESIQIAPFEIIQLLEFSYRHALNQHAYITWKAVIAEEKKHTYLEELDTATEITVSKRMEDGKEHRFFTGYLQDIQITNHNQVYYLEVTAVSASILLDIEKRRHSFQNITASYEDIINEVFSRYKNALYIDHLSNEQKTNQLYVQYEETDWEFLNRLAAMLGGNVLSMDQLAEPRIYFGLPDLILKGEIEASHYEIKRDHAKFRKITANTSYDIPTYSYIGYLVESLQLFLLGDKVRFQGREYAITEVKRHLDKGMLRNQYRLTYKKDAVRYPIRNKQLRGVSLKGTVKEVKDDKVLVSLDIDKKYGGRAEYWFSYSTSYTSEHHIGWYMMPEKEDRVRVHFPTESEKDAFAAASVRDDQGKADDLSPEIKTLKNKYGKTITLEPDKITICGNGTQIVLSDSQGVIIKSDQSVSISGKDHIRIHGNEIVMDAADQIKLSVSSNSITVDEKIVLNGTEVKMN